MAWGRRIGPLETLFEYEGKSGLKLDPKALFPFRYWRPGPRITEESSNLPVGLVRVAIESH
jgi:hypothetical protein